MEPLLNVGTKTFKHGEIMINTLSLCPKCYKKIQGNIVFKEDGVWMEKTCNEHGDFSAMMEKDKTFFSAFHREGSMGKNKSIIVHSHNKCNLKCSWCYYPMDEEEILEPEAVDQILGMYRDYNIMLSGGEPTIDPLFFEKVQKYHDFGWGISSITNMVKLADPEFFAKALQSPLLVGDTLNFACSFQHPKNHSQEVTDAKFKALDNFRLAGVKPSCIMFSIQSLDELDFIKEFYDRTNGLYPMIRIRTMFRNWNAKGIKQELFLSDLYKAFVEKFAEYTPRQSDKYEHSNLYCLYLEMGGNQVSLSSAPSVDDVDYHQCSRPVFMLARDLRLYPVPLAQIINEGITAGYKDGLKLEVMPCG